MENYADLMFRDQVADLQKADGSHDRFVATYPSRTQSEIGPDELGFISTRESFYIASTSPDGWPYIQHRGGPPGFLKPVGPSRLACLDYVGNRQFITMGHLANDARVSVFLMDYLNRARLKLQGRASLVPLADADPDILAQFSVEGTPAQRLLVIDVVAMDWNCPKYIPTLVPVEVANEATDRYAADLLAENTALKAEVAALKGSAQ